MRVLEGYTLADILPKSLATEVEIPVSKLLTMSN